MINLEQVKIVFFDFDDTLCIHTEHSSLNEEIYDIQVATKGILTWNTCETNEQIKIFMDICDQKGIKMALISTTKSFIHMMFKQKWVSEKYHYELENCCVGSQEAKLDMIKAISAARGYKSCEVLFVDDYWYQTERIEDAGFLACSPMEIVNFVNQQYRNMNDNSHVINNI